MTGPFTSPKPPRKAGRRKADPVVCPECREYWEPLFYGTGSHKNGGGTAGVAIAWGQVLDGAHPSRSGGGMCSVMRAETKAMIFGRALMAGPASAIVPEATDWAWLEDEGTSHWLALIGLTLVGGREGIGKTTIAFDVAAKLTRGELAGDLKGEPRDVIICAGEDDWAATIVPRLMAAGADLDRVHRVVSVDAAGFEGSLSLPADMTELAAICQTHDVALIILDPLMSVIDGKLDTHKDASVRQALGPLSRLAHQCRLAIIGLIHVNKAQGVDVLTSLMASRAFAAVARGVLFAAKVVPEVGADPSAGETFAFGQAKNNLAAKVRYALTYKIDGAVVGRDPIRDKAIVASRIVWTGRTEANIEDLVAEQQSRPTTKRETAGGKCAEWLEAHLREFGPTTKKALVELAGVRGFPPRMLERAGQSIGVVVQGLPGTTQTVWALPESLVVDVVNDVLDVLVVDVAHD